MEKFSSKHISIFKTIIRTGKYKPTYSDQEPATRTLVNRGLVEGKEDYSGVVMTDKAKELELNNRDKLDEILSLIP